MKNHAKIDDFGVTGVPKSTKMVPRSAPKVTLEISHEKGQRGTKNCEAFWCHLGDFGPPFGVQLGAKGPPKSSCLAYAKMTKNDVQDEASEKA